MPKLLLTKLLVLLCSSCLFAQSPDVDSLLLVVQKAADDTNKVVAYRMLTGIVKNTEPLKAVVYGKRGAALGIKLGWDKGIAGCLLNLSAAYIAAGKLDSALICIDSALIYSYKAGDPNRLALAFLNRADIHMQMQNLGQSLRDCDSSLQYAEKADNDDRRARVFQTIGSVYYMQQRYKESAGYYQRAYDLYQKINNQQMSAIVLNNQGNVYKHLRDFKKAEEVFLRAIVIGKQVKDLNNMSMYHENLSDVYLQNNQLDQAERYADLAMIYANEQQNNQQLANALENKGRIYLKKKQHTAAIDAGLQALQIAREDDLINTRYEASDLLSQAYAASGNMKQAYDYLLLNKAINDSLLRQQFDEDIAAMQTRFNVQEKDNAIRLLENEKQIQRQQLRQQRIMFTGSVIISLLVLAAIGLLINRYRLKQRMEQLSLRNRIAADLHDEVGSSLSSIHLLSQMASQKTGADNLQKDMLGRLSAQAKETMDKMSDIVWMIKPGLSEADNLQHRMSHFAYGLAESRNMNLQMDLAALEEWRLSTSDRKSIYLIFKEALNNAAKYSEAGKLEVRAGIEGRMRMLQIRDNGKGFDATTKGQGNGLANMKNRAAEMKGTLSITSAPAQGTEIRLLFPA